MIIFVYLAAIIISYIASCKGIAYLRCRNSKFEVVENGNCKYALARRGICGGFSYWEYLDLYYISRKECSSICKGKPHYFISSINPLLIHLNNREIFKNQKEKAKKLVFLRVAEKEPQSLQGSKLLADLNKATSEEEELRIIKEFKDVYNN